MLFRALALGVAIAALVAAPASAASTLAPLKPCYVAATPISREFVVIDGLGFTPLSAVDVYVDDILQPPDGTDPRRANYDTTVRSSVAAPFIEDGERMFALRVTEHDAPANTATQLAKVTRLSVEQSPERAATSDRVRFRGRGFMTRRADLRPLRVRRQVAAHGADRDAERRLRAVLGPAQAVPVQEAARAWALDDPVRPGGALQPEGPSARSADDSRPFADQAAAGSGALTRPLKRRSPSSASTTIRSPLANSPLSRPSASGSTRCLEITRFSGRAPYAGS